MEHGSESYTKKTPPSTPNWLLFLFGGAILWGVLYGTFRHGFQKDTAAAEYRKTAHVGYVVANMDAIPQKNAQTIANGEATFKAVCSACHGLDMKGTGAGPNLTDAEWLHSNKDSELAKLAINGIGAGIAKFGTGGMPAKGGRTDLSGEQMYEVLYYIGSKNPSLIHDSVATK